MRSSRIVCSVKYLQRGEARLEIRFQGMKYLTNDFNVAEHYRLLSRISGSAMSLTIQQEASMVDT